MRRGHAQHREQDQGHLPGVPGPDGGHPQHPHHPHHSPLPAAEKRHLFHQEVPQDLVPPAPRDVGYQGADQQGLLGFFHRCPRDRLRQGADRAARLPLDPVTGGAPGSPPGQGEETDPGAALPVPHPQLREWRHRASGAGQGVPGGRPQPQLLHDGDGCGRHQALRGAGLWHRHHLVAGGQRHRCPRPGGHQSGAPVRALPGPALLQQEHTAAELHV
ncbi:hypothetical protein D3C84_529510 [compost metagenome]